MVPQQLTDSVTRAGEVVVLQVKSMELLEVAEFARNRTAEGIRMQVELVQPLEATERARHNALNRVVVQQHHRQIRHLCNIIGRYTAADPSVVQVQFSVLWAVVSSARGACSPIGVVFQESAMRLIQNALVIRARLRVRALWVVPGTVVYFAARGVSTCYLWWVAHVVAAPSAVRFAAHLCREATTSLCIIFRGAIWVAFRTAVKIFR